MALALALGLRQGEALGLKREDVNLDKAAIRIRRNRLRPKYAHGCAGTCGRQAGYCPQRTNTRPATGKVKSKAGKRTIGLPPQLVALGWSSESMAARYQHVTDAVRSEVARQVGSLIWEARRRPGKWPTETRRGTRR